MLVSQTKGLRGHEQSRPAISVAPHPITFTTKSMVGDFRRRLVRSPIMVGANLQLGPPGTRDRACIKTGVHIRDGSKPVILIPSRCFPVLDRTFRRRPRPSRAPADPHLSVSWSPLPSRAAYRPRDDPRCMTPAVDNGEVGGSQKNRHNDAAASSRRANKEDHQGTEAPYSLYIGSRLVTIKVTRPVSREEK
jgi:hypothetical protein